MQRQIRRALAITVVTFAACGGEGDPGQTTGPTETAAPLAAAVTFSDRYPSLFLNDTLRLYAKATTATGDSVTRAMAWASSNASVATVSSGGVVTAIAAGMATIKATTDTASAAVELVVLPRASRPSTTLAYGNLVGTQRAVVVASIDGTIIRTHTQPSNTLTNYAWSPDGTRLLIQLASPVQTFVVDPDGVEQANFTKELPVSAKVDDFGPIWSPDGTKLLYFRPSGTLRVIETMSVATKEVTTLSATPANYQFPRWSPDGRRYSFLRAAAGGFELVVNVFGGSASRVITLPTSGVIPTAPEWSPDGKYIAFAGNRAVFVTTPDGRLSKIVADCGSLSSCTVSNVSWAPDARRFIFTRAGTLVVKDALGLNPDVIVNETCCSFHAAWSPDGEWIAYEKTGGNGMIYLMRPTGAEPKPLNGGPGTIPAWRP